MTARRRVVAVLALAVAAVLVAVLARLAEDGPVSAPTPEATSAGRWVELARPPLSPRSGGLAVWTGAEALFLGGAVARHCPPNAGCMRPEVVARDGAAYDPAARTWRRTAEAPVAVGAGLLASWSAAS